MIRQLVELVVVGYDQTLLPSTSKLCKLSSRAVKGSKLAHSLGIMELKLMSIPLSLQLDISRQARRSLAPITGQIHPLNILP
jgi:hypothetical protein